MDEPLVRRKFQLTDLSGNNNKWWMIEQHNNGTFTTHWGRVGNAGQSVTKYGDRWAVEDMIRSKIRKGYVEVDLHIPQAVTVSGAPSGLSPRLDQIVSAIFTEAGEHIASYLSVGVDALSARQIDKGKHILKKITSDVERGIRSALRYDVQDFYNTIPTKLPHRIDPDQVVTDFIENLDEQEDRLQQLEAAVNTYTVQKSTGQSNYSLLGAELELLPETDPQYDVIVGNVATSSVHGWRPRIRDIVTVKIPDERTAYEQETFGKNNTGLLWHGTRAPNVRHILTTGLIVPRTPSNGRMFGNGIYFADKFSKAGNYCDSYRSSYKFAFLANVALGKMYVAPDAMSSLNKAPDGYHSVWGKAGHTGSWGGGLAWNEFIVYKKSQQSINYMVVFER